MEWMAYTGVEFGLVYYCMRNKQASKHSEAQ